MASGAQGLHAAGPRCGCCFTCLRRVLVRANGLAGRESVRRRGSRCDLGCIGDRVACFRRAGGSRGGLAAPAVRLNVTRFAVPEGSVSSRGKASVSGTGSDTSGCIYAAPRASRKLSQVREERQRMSFAPGGAFATHPGAGGDVADTERE